METVTVTIPVEDQGSIVIFEGFDIYGDTVTFAVDHRMAQALVDALADDEEVICGVEPWQILSRVA